MNKNKNKKVDVFFMVNEIVSLASPHCIYLRTLYTLYIYIFIRAIF